MATHRMDVSVRFGVPGLLETQVETSELPLFRVPDVRMRSEAAASATIAKAGLVAGQRDPRPRPAGGRFEVVIRANPGEGALARQGTRVDYDMLPGEPREPRDLGAYVDYDSAASLEADAEPLTPHAVEQGRPPYVDYDVIDTLFRSGHRLVEGRA